MTVLRILQLLVFLLFLVLLVNAVLNRGGDFVVYWRTGQNLLAGEPLYSVQRDGGFCYKYPPWMALPLVPLGLFPLTTAAIFWRLLLVASLFQIWRWTTQMLKSQVPALLALILLWGIWVQNVVTGQMTLPLLAVALWAFEMSEKQPVLSALATTQALAAKVFHVFAALGFSRKQFHPRPWAVAFGICLLASIPALWGYRHSEGTFNLLTAPQNLLENYFAAMSSGDQKDLGGGLYGLPVLWAKWFGMDPISTRARLLGFVPSFLIAGLLLFILRFRWKGQAPRELYAVALALACAIHPLTFTYALAWLYPALALSLQLLAYRPTEKRGGARVARAIWIVGALLLVFFNTKLSTRLGISLWEGYPVKAIGTLLICSSLGLISPDFGTFESPSPGDPRARNTV